METERGRVLRHLQAAGYRDIPPWLLDEFVEELQTRRAADEVHRPPPPAPVRPPTPPRTTTQHVMVRHVQHVQQGQQVRQVRQERRAGRRGRTAATDDALLGSGEDDYREDSCSDNDNNKDDGMTESDDGLSLEPHLRPLTAPSECSFSPSSFSSSFSRPCTAPSLAQRIARGSDPVTRFRAQQRVWQADSFVEALGTPRKAHDLNVPASTYFPPAPRRRGDPHDFINPFVPPTDNRRDALRWAVRHRLLHQR